MKPKYLILILVLVMAAAAGAFLATRFFRDRGFEAVKPRRGDLTEAVYGLGKVKCDRRFEVKIGVLSTVKNIFVREGDFVTKGARLIEFESNALFRAPFDGTVTLIVPNVGETALPNVTQLRLEDLKDRYIELSLEQESALRVRKGQPARISFESLRGQVLEGKVSALFSREDEFLAHIEAGALDESVLPGMTADVSVEVGKISDALLIPLRAVSGGQVFVRKNGKRQKIKLEIGHVDGQWAEVTGGGLAEGDEILVPKARE